MAKAQIPETVVAEVAAAIAALWEEGCPVASQRRQRGLPCGAGSPRRGGA